MVNQIKMIRDIVFFTSAVLYFPTIYAIKVYMAKQPYEVQRDVNLILKFPNALWDLGLSIFSTLGAYHTITQYYVHGFSCGYVVDTYWIDLFCISKVFELLDTVFIVARSRPLVVLQYYHHFATLLLCWMANKVYPPELFGFALMNYSVHSVLCMYNFFMGIGYTKVRNYGVFITFFQTLQMVVAVYILLTNKMRFCVEYPHIDVNMLYWYTFSMYSSYVILFGELFWRKLKSK
jgi:hypothetical protein